MSVLEDDDGRLVSDGPVQTTLQPQDYGKGGELNSLQADLSLVIGSATAAETFVVSKQWNLLWRDADLDATGVTLL